MEMTTSALPQASEKGVEAASAAARARGRNFFITYLFYHKSARFAIPLLKRFDEIFVSPKPRVRSAPGQTICCV